MANAVYPKAKEAFLSGAIDLTTDTIKVALIDLGVYTYSAAHQFYSDISGVVGTDQTLAGKSVTNGLFDANDALWASQSGASVEAVVIYQDTGVAATSRLIAYIDDDTVTPNGGDITAVWDNGANRIFQL